MQLILRGAARTLGAAGSVVLAASPDSLARQPWQWDVRVAREPVGVSVAADGAGIGPHHVCVRHDAAAVDVDLRAVRLGPAPARLERPSARLWVAVVEQGVVVHGAFALDPGDVVVWEGDDPEDVRLEPAEGAALLVVADLGRTDGQALRWVP
ncbi:MAG: hypothetical protein GC157_12990 [Frankiales bacterium]|nr:hypothetical protein [Frankiales bacterium]